MNRRQIGVEQGKTVALQQPFDGLNIVVKQMLVIDLIEGNILHDALHIQELHDKDAPVPASIVHGGHCFVSARSLKKSGKRQSASLQVFGDDNIAFRAAAGLIVCVQQNGGKNPCDKFFTPWRFALLLALLILATFPQVLLGLETFVIRDYGFFAYPLAHFQHECFWHGELPLWDPYNNCGVPFLAQWNTMPLYPPSLIYLLLPLQWSLGFFCLLHLWFAGFGMFFLARRWTGNSFAAAFAGVAFAFNGLTLNLLMWPSHIATLSWMPWVVLAVELAWREGGQKIILAAFIGALQMLAGGPETILFTWVILLVLWALRLWRAAFVGALQMLAGGPE